MNANSDILARVKESAVQLLADRNAAPANFYIENSILPAGHVINAQHQDIPVDGNTVMVFADEAPLFNWGHTCRYMLYTADNGSLYKEVPAQFPPYLIDPPESFELFKEMVKKPAEPVLWPKLSTGRLIKIPWGNRFAVLFSGASNNRHVNDLEFLYRELITQYGFKAENIFVLNYDGTTRYSGAPAKTVYPPDQSAYKMVVNGKGTKTDLEAVFDTLKNRLRSTDLLLIHTNNHGGRSTESYLCTYDSPAGYGAEDFAIKLGTLPRYRHLMVMMEQCFSGGFVDPILSHTTAAYTSVATACVSTQSSMGGADFDPFAKDWISAMAKHDPYGAALAFDPDTNHDGKICALEAFSYAKAVKVPYDTPVYNQSSATAGMADLLQKYLVIRIPWFATAVADALRPYQDKLPAELFYAKIYGELGPSLTALEAEADNRENSLNEEIAPRIQELVDNVMQETREAEEVVERPLAKAVGTRA